MTHQAKVEIIRHYRKMYAKGAKREKSQILNIILEITGYSRKHVIALLTNPPGPKKTITRARSSRYAHLYETIKRIWALSRYNPSLRNPSNPADSND